MTAGMLCSENGRVMQNCSWSARVGLWLRHKLPGAANVSYHNLARSGTTTTGFLPSAVAVVRQVLTEEGVADESLLCFLDYGVNDAYEYERYHEEHGGLTQDVGVSVVTERLVQSILIAAPRAALVGVLLPCRLCYRLSSAHARVFEHYALPSLDLTLLPSHSKYWPRCKKAQHCKYASEVHPTFEWHELYARAVIWGLARAASPASTIATVQRARNGTAWSTSKLECFPICTSGNFYFSSHDAYRRLGAVPCAHSILRGQSEGCMLEEDRPGKPGWILRQREGHATSYVEFVVSFGQAPTLSLSYVRSYEGTEFGDALLRLNGRDYMLVGRQDASRTTQTHTEFFTVGMNAHADQQRQTSPEATAMQLSGFIDGGAKGFGVARGAHNMTVRVESRFTSRRSKFILVSLSAC